MIKTTAMLLEEYKNYRSPANKVSRLASKGEIIPIVKGLYETDKTVSGYLLAGSIYGPSYLSFEFALSQYGLIPEAVYTFTSATFEKKKKKIYNTPFGTFLYRDVPPNAFPKDIKIYKENEYSFLMASKEKALCDLLYTKSPVGSQKELISMLFEDMRIEEQEFDRLDKEKLCRLSTFYHCRNLQLLTKVIRRTSDGPCD